MLKKIMRRMGILMPIRFYFPNQMQALYLLEKGVEKYKNSKKYTITNEDMPFCNGRLFYEGHPVEYQDDWGGKLFISPGLAAVMYATGKEPRWYDLNTPFNTYNWSFNDTRDIIGALDALYRGNDFYWNIIYGQEGNTKIINYATGKKLRLRFW